MTITDRIDRARRSFAAHYEEEPWALVLGEGDLRELDSSKLAKQRLQRLEQDGIRGYAGLPLMLWVKDLHAGGPVVVSEKTMMALFVSNFICWA